jgi:hypothetical protein
VTGDVGDLFFSDKAPGAEIRRYFFIKVKHDEN